MITCVSLNPSIDRTLTVPRLVPGGLNRVASQTDAAAGKGVNVALAAAALGEDAACIGFMYREGARLFEQRLAGAGVAGDFMMCEGAVRVNVKVLDEERGEITELNSSGAPVSEAQLKAMAELALRHAGSSDFIILSGSLPPGCPVDYYRVLGEAAGEAGCRVILDADGDRLRRGLEAKPFLIKPNRSELEMLTGRKLETPDALLEAALGCVRAGVGVAAVSMGAEGALITDGTTALRTPGLKVEIRSTVAAGDSMIAGLAAGFRRGYTLEDAFRLGVAAATARCATPPEAFIPPELCMRFADELKMEKMA